MSELLNYETHKNMLYYSAKLLCLELKIEFLKSVCLAGIENLKRNKF
jgi:hypothetical protein